MQALGMTRELVQCSPKELQKASKMIKTCKYMGVASGCVLAGASLFNLYINSQSKEERPYATALVALPALASALSFINVGSINKMQKMVNIAKKFVK